jgi:hypothetical protein
MTELLPICQSKLYPEVPDPVIPLPTHLSNLTGIYNDPGYGIVRLSLECKAPSLPSDSPARPTADGNGCFLVARLDTPEENGGITLHALFEHVTGDYWIAWAYVDQLSDAGYRRPVHCLRAQFVMDYTGTVSKLGLDLRLEEIDGPLVWLNRIDGTNNSSFIIPTDILGENFLG